MKGVVKLKLDFSKPMIMGILNVTPDSFSEDGQPKDLEHIVKTAKQMVADGARIIDIGGESTRPGAQVVTLEEELQRVIPVIKRLRQEIDAFISIDTYKADVARQAVAAGAHMINDIGGALFDEKMPQAMAESSAYVVLMHNRKPDLKLTNTLTVNQGELAQYDDIVSQVKQELNQSIETVIKAGVAPDKIIIDPGIGFAKTIDGNIELMQRLDELHDLGYPILLGVSKKGTIGHLLGGLDVTKRLEGTMATTCFAVVKQVQIIRVHDVLENARCLQVMQKLMS